MPLRARAKLARRGAARRSQRISLKEPHDGIFDYSSNADVAEEPPPSPTEIRDGKDRDRNSEQSEQRRKKVVEYVARVVFRVKSQCASVHVCVCQCVCIVCVAIKWIVVVYANTHTESDPYIAKSAELQVKFAER